MTAALNLLAVQNAPVLRALRDRPEGGWPTIADLADHLKRDRSNLSKTLNKLEDERLAAFNPLIHGLTAAGAEQLAMIDRAERGGDDEPGSPADAGGVVFLTHAQILPDPANARRDWDSDEARDDLDSLRSDILQNGLLQNLVVRGPEADVGGVRIANGQGEFAPLYTLVGGERRWRAIGIAITDGDWEVDTPIPCRLLDTDDLGHRLAALAENLQRRNLNPIEKANAFEGLALAGLTNKEIADRVSSTPEHVQQHRRFLQLDADDQARMTLGRDDPRHLSVREARQKLAKKDDGPPAIELEPMARLAWIELTHAAYHHGEHTNLWDPIPVAVGAAATPEGQRLTEIGAVDFSADRQRHGKHIGRFTAKRHYEANRIRLAQPIPFSSSEAAESLRAEQIATLGDAAPVWAGDTPCYATPWLADIGEMDDDGQAIIDARRAEEAEAAEILAERQRQSVARARLWADARARHVRLLEASQAAPTAGEPAEVIAIATDIDRPFPWSAFPNGFIVAANGATVKQPHYYGAPTDQELAVNQMIVVAANTSAGLATPTVATPDDEPHEEADDADGDGETEDIEVSEDADDDASERAEGEPAVPIDQSITPDFLVCLEDGRKFKSLKRHLRTRFDLSPEAYRTKWGLPDDYPMQAPNYAKARAELAAKMGAA